MKKYLIQLNSSGYLDWYQELENTSPEKALEEAKQRFNFDPADPKEDRWIIGFFEFMELQSQLRKYHEQLMGLR